MPIKVRSVANLNYWQQLMFAAELLYFNPLFCTKRVFSVYHFAHYPLWGQKVFNLQIYLLNP